LYRLYEQRLLSEVAQGPIPRHLGLIQDGHRRYAREAGLFNLKGDRLGGTKRGGGLTWGGYLANPVGSPWWASRANLSRGVVDVSAVLDVIEATIPEWVHGGLAARLGMRIRPIGKLDLLPDSVLGALELAASATDHHDRLLLNVGVGYGGRQEIIDAVKGYLHEAFVRQDSPEDILEGISAESLAKHLYTCDCRDPDLIIRTSGEVRLSGFMLWQSAYSEFYFCDAYWPVFRKIDFLRAIRSYQQRHRRFGR